MHHHYIVHTFHRQHRIIIVYLYVYDVNIRYVILITATCYLIDIVTESEREFTDEKIVPAGCTVPNYNYSWSTI